MKTEAGNQIGKLVLDLTDAEYEVFLALGDGKSSKQIATERGVSIKTVETQLVHLRRKLAVTTMAKIRVTAARFLERHGRLERRKLEVAKREFVPS